MFSNSINSLNIVFRAGCIAAIAAVMLLQAGEVVAQRLQPLDNESESAVSVEAIYGLTKTARKYDDFLTIRERCNTLLKDDLAEKLEAKIKEMQPQVKLKGFRPGKVPASHIRKIFGQSIMNDVVQDVVAETTQKALEDNKIRPAGQPKIDLRANGEDVTKGKADLEYTLSVETIPEFEFDRHI